MTASRAATRCWQHSSTRARSLPACAPPTRSMRARPKPPPSRWRRPAPASISPAGRANASRRCGPPASTDFIFAGCDVLAALRTAHAPHCQLTAKPSDCRRAARFPSPSTPVTNDEQSRTPFRLAQAHRPLEPDRDRDRGLRFLSARPRGRVDVRHHLQHRSLEPRELPAARARPDRHRGQISRLAPCRLHHPHRHAGGDHARQGLRGGAGQADHRRDRTCPPPPASARRSARSRISASATSPW